ncbi:adenylate/guanylate cyclase domain-containing protein [Hoeflea prorocentri]|uniref:Adenylate/guanylate cyclase domain-containing protein n=1 Tax=Hoeflea prorocentri TaxID=1922333 RepID=A0A9X3UM28_9HYPH|nr:adenylate/guanylate cyclase domain-containing protein [Hoeflea prorocentri]MCY6383335.1 adenylate/guanylate cyclase domain-containing protein [Hoeflea prorocentri]MDA5401135.1 adenylate/guanylate cyclase domain-containing protein [Hoeflea prorocentri]
MSEQSIWTRARRLWGLPRSSNPATGDADHRFAEAALERHKREGMVLAFRTRFAAMVLIAVMLPFINFSIEVIYYQALALSFILIGWAQFRVARVGVSRAELLLLWCDLILMAIVLLVPNPLSDNEWPLAMQYRFEGFMYFYVLLALGTLAYSWRTVRGIGVMTAGLWMISFGIVWLVSSEDVALTEAVNGAFLPDGEMARLLNPNNLLAYIRVQEVIVFLIVAVTLSVTVRRYSNLLMGHAALERERENLARYFSPNVVEELSHNDEPLKKVRTQDIAVLFVDIVGFTEYAADKSSEDVIGTLREFHQRMEEEVFSHNGTLDKYLGDGLMATFGTPIATDRDAVNALRCARSMMQSMARWNQERSLAGEPPLRASFGLHYGPAVLGDIGSNRLEFAVIGNTVNVASRVEALTRGLTAELAATDELLERVREEDGADGGLVSDFTRHDDVAIRGLESGVTVWTLPPNTNAAAGQGAAG